MGGVRADNRAADPADDARAKKVVADYDGGEESTNLEYAPRPQRGPVLDWGATVWLSNDDSMSLASAQRLLWAVDRGRSYTTDQVRPHELLNYFSFDTETPRGSDTFAVRGSAVRTAGDQLTVAFTVKGASPAPEPLDLTLVVDRSGSMSAEGRMTYVKRGLDQMVAQLNPGDRVDLVLFDDSVCTPLQDYVVGRDDPRLLSDAIAQMAPRGSTDLDAGLREGYRIASGRYGAQVDGRNQRVMLLTDAILNTGNVDANLVSEVSRAYDEAGIRLTGIGVGTEFRDDVLDRLTEKGKGAYVFLGSEAVVDRVFGVGFPSLVQTIAHDVQMAVHLPDSLAMTRFYGEEASTDRTEIQPIHYYAGTSQLFLQDLSLRDYDPRDPITFEIQWTDAKTGAARTDEFRYTVGELVGADPHDVNKARALMAWSDVLLQQSMSRTGCSGAPLDTFRQRVGLVSDDVEMAYVAGLVAKQCRVDMTLPPPPPPQPAVAWKVKVDSDVPIAEVALACANGTQRDMLTGSDTVASFQAFPGACSLTLMGAVPMTVPVEVAAVGGQARCVVRGGRVSCS
jgi:Ca-activated chloride channel family protein